MLASRWMIGAALFASLLFGSGCGRVSPMPAEENAAATTTWMSTEYRSADWQPLMPGADRAVFHVVQPSLALTMYRFDPNFFSWHVSATTTPHTLTDWADLEPGAVFMTNGAYFQANGYPAGFLLTHGKRFGSRAFDRGRSGLISLSPEPRIIDLQATTSALESLAAQEAIQSYPFLIKQGESAIDADSGQAARRTFFGLDRYGRVYMGVVDQDAVSLFQLSRILAALPIEWLSVINLDGGSSTGLAARFPSFKEQLPSIIGVPNVLAVEPTPAVRRRGRSNRG